MMVEGTTAVNSGDIVWEGAKRKFLGWLKCPLCYRYKICMYTHTHIHGHHDLRPVCIQSVSYTSIEKNKVHDRAPFSLGKESKVRVIRD